MQLKLRSKNCLYKLSIVQEEKETQDTGNYYSVSEEDMEK